MTSLLNSPRNTASTAVAGSSSATPGATRNDATSQDSRIDDRLQGSSLHALLNDPETVLTRTSSKPPSESTETTRSSPSANSSFVSRTPAQKKRERKLRDDPMAEVLGPTAVVCKRCWSTIKLSPKSTYDPFHWNKHKERCLKRPEALVEQKKQEAKEKSRFPKLQTSSRSVSVSKASSPKECTPPPLTPDSDEDRSSFDHLKEESPAPDLSPSLHIREPDPEVEDYLSRSHRKIIRELPPLSPEDWKNWSWSHLKRPVWDQSTMFHLSTNDGDEDDLLMRDMSDRQVCLHQVSNMRSTSVNEPPTARDIS